MLNWYIFKTAQSKALGYGSWISPEGEIITVINFQAHGEVAINYLKKHLDLFSHYLETNGDEIPEDNEDLMYKFSELSEDMASNILKLNGFVRIVNTTYGKVRNFFVECVIKMKPIQEKIIAQIIEYQKPQTVFIDNEERYGKTFTAEEAIDFLKGTQTKTYTSPFNSFR